MASESREAVLMIRYDEKPLSFGKADLDRSELEPEHPIGFWSGLHPLVDANPGSPYGSDHVAYDRQTRSRGGSKAGFGKDVRNLSAMRETEG